MVQSGLQRVKATVFLPNFFSTMAENQYTALILQTRTCDLHSAFDQARYKSISATKSTCNQRKIRRIRLKRRGFPLPGVWRGALEKSTSSTVDGFSWLLRSWITYPAPEKSHLQSQNLWPTRAVQASDPTQPLFFTHFIQIVHVTTGLWLR